MSFLKSKRGVYERAEFLQAAGAIAGTCIGGPALGAAVGSAAGGVVESILSKSGDKKQGDEDSTELTEKQQEQLRIAVEKDDIEAAMKILAEAQQAKGGEEGKKAEGGGGLLAGLAGGLLGGDKEGGGGLGNIVEKGLSLFG